MRIWTILIYTNSTSGSLKVIKLINLVQIKKVLLRMLKWLLNFVKEFEDTSS